MTNIYILIKSSPRSRCRPPRSMAIKQAPPAAVKELAAEKRLNVDKDSRPCSRQQLRRAVHACPASTPAGLLTGRKVSPSGFSFPTLTDYDGIGKRSFK